MTRPISAAWVAISLCACAPPPDDPSALCAIMEDEECAGRSFAVVERDGDVAAQCFDAGAIIYRPDTSDHIGYAVTVSISPTRPMLWLLGTCSMQLSFKDIDGRARESSSRTGRSS
jgi:hypothetical protein